MKYIYKIQAWLETGFMRSWWNILSHAHKASDLDYCLFMYMRLVLHSQQAWPNYLVSSIATLVFWDKFVNISLFIMCTDQHDNNPLFMVCNHRSSSDINCLLTRFITHPITPSLNPTGWHHYSLDLLGSTYQFMWPCLVIITGLISLHSWGKWKNEIPSAVPV